MDINLISLTKELAAHMSGKDLPAELQNKILYHLGSTDPEVINAVALAWDSIELTNKEKWTQGNILKSLIFDIRALKYAEAI